MKRGIIFFLLTITVLTGVAQNKVLVITPHPDDAEASCGGYIANATAAGDTVIILTMTGGEYGIGGKIPAEAAAIRKNEAINGAAILHATVEFFGASDAFLFVDTNSTARLASIIEKIHPSIVLAPWPLDVHNDHQATGMLAWRVFQDRRSSFRLFFYETSNEPHTTSFAFRPTVYVDITGVSETKKKAVMAHISQNPAGWYNMYEVMATFRGYESDVKMAEGYIEATNSSGMGGRENRVQKTLN